MVLTLFRLGRIPCPIPLCLWLRVQNSTLHACHSFGSCFCPAAVAVPAQARLQETPALAGDFQGPQAPGPIGISSCRCSGFGVQNPEILGLEHGFLGC